MIKRFFFFFTFSYLLSSCHVGRFFIYNFADIRDNRKFRSAAIKASDKPFHFTQPSVASLHPKAIKVKGKEIAFEDVLKKSGTVSFVVIRNDSVVYSWSDEKFTNKDIPSFSMAKSFISALIGIAIKEGKIKSTDEPITNYLNFKRQKDFEKITIQNLLDMRSGISFGESYINPFGDVAKHYYGRHLKRYCYNLKVYSEPDKQFEYISVNTQLLGLIIEKATSMSISKYFEESLWKKIGTEFDATWSLDRKAGTEKTFCCLNARTMDFAKFGRLYLNEGKWEGEQVVPKDWVMKARNSNANDYHYSDQWWHTRYYYQSKDSTKLSKPYSILKWNDKQGNVRETLIKPTDDLMAEGINGQFIYIRPTSNMIIVRLGKRYGNVDWHSLFRRMTM